MVAASLLAGCTPIRDRQGFIMDSELIAAVKPGVDNRDSVLGTLGRPNFTGQFDERDWYYVSRDTKQRAFRMPTPSNQTVLRVRFDESGNVERVDRSGMELVANINPSDRETPTLGRSRSFFDEIFGNIGAAGASSTRPTGTSDNPQ